MNAEGQGGLTMKLTYHISLKSRRNDKPFKINCVCTYNMCEHVHTYIIAVNPLTCSEISRAAFIRMSWQQHVATYQGQQDFEVRQDFKEYSILGQTI